MSSRRGRPRKSSDDILREQGKTHVHTSSLEQWQMQVRAILKNIDMLEKERITYQNLSNSTMKRIIAKNLETRKAQLKQKLKERPPKDRAQDFATNHWVSELA